jgi:hypothetical protein
MSQYHRICKRNYERKCEYKCEHKKRTRLWKVIGTLRMVPSQTSFTTRLFSIALDRPTGDRPTRLRGAEMRRKLNDTPLLYM